METQIFVADTSPLMEEGNYQTVLKALPPWRQEKASHYRYQMDKAACVGAFLLLMHALSVNHITMNAPEFIYNSYGKPSLKGQDSLHFNLSHSGNRVLCILGDSPNGCDVQRIEKKGDKIAAHFFHEKKIDYLASLSGETQRTNAFYQMWSLKESYLKALDTGLATPLTEVPVDLAAMTIPDSKFSIKLYPVEEDYVYSAAGAQLPKSIQPFLFSV